MVSYEYELTSGANIIIYLYLCVIVVPMRGKMDLDPFICIII